MAVAQDSPVRSALMQETYVGRQAIYDRSHRVVAYELLFRRAKQATADVADGDRATAEVILNALTVFGLDRLVGAVPAFINMTRPFIMGAYPLPTADRVVLEVLEDVEVDDELVAALAGLRHRGYRVALDDFVFHAHLRPLVELAEFVKIDVLGLSDADVALHVERLRPYPVRLLAEKVETGEQLAACADLGFELFQGYHLGRPDVVEGSAVTGTRLGVLRVLEQLHRPDVELDELSALISQELSISYKLLRLVNAAHHGLPRHIDSIRDALLLLGQETVARWVTVIALAQGRDESPDLIESALTRARLCELLSAGPSARLAAGRPFLVGLLSMLDVLVGRPLEDLLEGLPLSDEIVDALLHHAGRDGAVLDVVVGYERHASGEDEIPDSAAAGESGLPGLYLEAAAWASEITRMVTAV